MLSCRSINVMDGLNWRNAVTAFVISIFMVSQARAAKPKQYSSQYRDFHQQQQQHHENTLAIDVATTTAFPVNPYVFSAEDYDLLQQNVDSLQGARSIVSYESQRIDPRKSSEMSLEWHGSSTIPPTPLPSSSTEAERKFYEVPKKRARGDVLPLSSSRIDTSLAYQSTNQQRRRGIINTTAIPKVIDRRRLDAVTRRQQPAKNNNHEIIDQDAAGLMFVLNNRIPRPFGFTTESTNSFTTQSYTANKPSRGRHNHRSTPPDVVSTGVSPTVTVRRTSTINIANENIERPTTREPPIIYTIPKRRRPRPTIPTLESSETKPSYQTIIPLQQKRHPTEKPSTEAPPVQQIIVYTEAPSVEETDYYESDDIPPTEVTPAKDDDRREYNYSHVERYEEPLETTKESEEPYDADEAGDQIVPVAEVSQDLASEGDQHHKAHEKPEKHHEEGEEGASEEHGEGDHHEEGDKGHKGYKNYHEHEKGEKGHHKKEGHDHHYDEEDGDAKKHHDEAGYHEEHEKGEEGEKKKAFHEKGKHNKGHSTKGEHVVHKKDAFEKKIEFYDESHEGGDDEKEGGHHIEHHKKKGGHHKKGHHHKGHDEAHEGKKGHYDKGHHHHTKKGHHKEKGDDHHYHHEEKYGKKGGHEDAKKWHHKKGKRR